MQLTPSNLTKFAKKVRRSGLDTTKVAKALIKRKEDFLYAKCFGDIHFLVQLVSSKFKNCGPTYVYDLARLISSERGFKQKILYIHKSNKKALKELGIEFRYPWLEKSDLPKHLQKLDFEEIEDILRRRR